MKKAIFVGLFLALSVPFVSLAETAPVHPLASFSVSDFIQLVKLINAVSPTPLTPDQIVTLLQLVSNSTQTTTSAMAITPSVTNPVSGVASDIVVQNTGSVVQSVPMEQDANPLKFVSGLVESRQIDDQPISAQGVYGSVYCQNCIWVGTNKPSKLSLVIDGISVTSNDFSKNHMFKEYSDSTVSNQSPAQPITGILVTNLNLDRNSSHIISISQMSAIDESGNKIIGYGFNGGSDQQIPARPLFVNPEIFKLKSQYSQYESHASTYANYSMYKDSTSDQLLQELNAPGLIGSSDAQSDLINTLLEMKKIEAQIDLLERE